MIPFFKKFTLAVCAAAVLISLSGCGSKNSADEELQRAAAHAEHIKDALKAAHAAKANDYRIFLCHNVSPFLCV